MDEKLTKREKQIAGLVAWGASFKEVPDLIVQMYGGREISTYTVQNTIRKIYEKLHLNRINELSAWWFTHVHGVDTEEAPAPSLKQRLLALVFLIILSPQIAGADLDQALRPARTRTSARTERVERGRRRDETV